METSRLLEAGSADNFSLVDDKKDVETPSADDAFGEFSSMLFQDVSEVLSSSKRSKKSSISHQFALKVRNELEKKAAMPDAAGRRRQSNLMDSVEEEDDDNDDGFTLNKLDFTDQPMVGRDEAMSRLWNVFNDVLVTYQENKANTSKFVSSNPQGDDMGGDEEERMVKTDPCTLVSISGVSGTGKSMLAQSLRPAVKKSNGYFCCGKFDLQRHVEPYSGFISAFSNLVEQILVKDETQMSLIAQRIQKALGQQASIITSVVPLLTTLLLLGDGTELELGGEDDDDKHHDQADFSTEEDKEYVIDDDKSDEQEVDSVKTKSNQVQFIFRQFARAVCSDGSPVVLLLDDMQWADEPSMQLLETLVTDVENPLFMVVTTCREEEESGNLFLKKSLPSFQDHGVIVHSIPIGNLSQEAVISIAARALRLSSSSSSDVTRVKPLAQVVHRKTHGNAFFVREFLNSLVETETLHFNFGSMTWMWDLQEIETMDVTENVADLLQSSFTKLPPECQLMLQVASFLGQSFNAEVFVAVMEKVREKKIDCVTSHVSTETEQNDYETVDQVMDRLVQARFLDRKGATYTFTHDQVQGMAYNVIDDPRKRTRLELIIGERLLEYALRNDVDQHLFLAVELLNSSIRMFGKVEKLGLARYNLHAGRKAMKKAAFHSSRKFFEFGLEGIGVLGDCATRNNNQEENWSQHSQLILDLSIGALEAAYCVGEFNKMEQHLDRVINANDVPFESKIRAYLTRVLSLGVQEKFSDAIDTGLFALKEMGMAKNLSRQPSMIAVLRELLKTRRLLRKHTLESFESLPVLADKKRELAMGIIYMMSSMTYISCPNLHFIAFFKATRWSIKYGVCKYSPPAIGTYAVLVDAILGQTKEAFMLGEACLAMDDRLKATDTSAQTVSTVYGYVAHWSQSLHLSEKPLMYGQQVGLESGEVEMACHCLVILDLGRLLTASRNLDMLSRDLESHVHIMKEHKQDAFGQFSCLVWQTVLSLTGHADQPTVLTGRAMDEEKVKVLILETKNRTLESMMNSFKMQLSYLFGDYESAVALGLRTKDFGVSVGQGMVLIPVHFFFRGLAMTATAIAGKNVGRNLRGAKQATKALQKWATKGNPNCVHMIKLLEAEISVIEKKKSNELIADLYKEAVNVAGRNGFLQDKGLAHYRSALFHLSRKDDYWAAYHLDNAVQCYHGWGAKAMTTYLLTKHGSALERSSGLSDCSRKFLLEMDSSAQPQPETAT